MDDFFDEDSVYGAMDQSGGAVDDTAVADFGADEELPVFESVYDFVDQFIVVMYATSAHGQKKARWSRVWWKYSFAVVRLTALWQRFEQLARDEPDTYVETFLRMMCDYHMNQLMAPGGVFDDVRTNDGEAVPLPVKPIPDGGED